MNCPEFKVFGSPLLWIWLYWRDVPRAMIPLRVWLNPLNYEVSLFWPPSYKSNSRRRLVTINREGQWIRNRIWRLREAVKRAIAAAKRGAEAQATEDRILWGVVANAGRLSSERAPRWSHVMEATGLGSSSAIELCRRFGFDPHEKRGGENIERCESGQPECGPVEHHDSDGMPLCRDCWDALEGDGHG